MSPEDERFSDHTDINAFTHRRQKSRSKSDGYRTFDKWVLVHFFLIFCVSFLFGILIIHTSLLWHRHQAAVGENKNKDFVMDLIYQLFGAEYKPSHSNIQVTANTSVYVS